MATTAAQLAPDPWLQRDERATGDDPGAVEDSRA